jgi:hypothetical protein
MTTIFLVSFGQDRDIKRMMRDTFSIFFLPVLFRDDVAYGWIWIRKEE